jgi:hypothetical protein
MTKISDTVKLLIKEEEITCPFCDSNFIILEEKT